MPTAALIQELLRENGWNIENPIEFDCVEGKQHGTSWTHHLSMSCTGGAEIPANLLLKTHAGENREYQFYKHSLGQGYPIPRCFALRAGPPSLILMEDLSASHSEMSDWPKPLPQQATHWVLDAIARFHAASWDTFDHAGLPDFLADQRAYQTFLGYLKRDLENYTTGLSASLEPERRSLFISVLDYLPRLWEEVWQKRLETKRALPLIHGDLNPGNILYPNQAGGRVVLVDWEAYRRGLPTSDLAMLFALHLCPEYDEVLPFLHAYHNCLYQAGVREYSFSSLLEDYQIALMFEMFYPIKLYSQAGILDQAMMDNAVTALESFSAAAG